MCDKLTLRSLLIGGYSVMICIIHNIQLSDWNSIYVTTRYYVDVMYTAIYIAIYTAKIASAHLLRSSITCLCNDSLFLSINIFYMNKITQQNASLCKQ